MPVSPPDATQVQVEVEAVEEVPPAAPVENDIVISVLTDPDGVNVKVRVKKGDKALKLELASAGFATHQLDVIPDRDQRLYFALMKQQKQIVRVKTPPKPDRKPGFRRFD